MKRRVVLLMAGAMAGAPALQGETLHLYMYDSPAMHVVLGAHPQVLVTETHPPASTMFPAGWPGFYWTNIVSAANTAGPPTDSVTVSGSLRHVVAPHGEPPAPAYSYKYSMKATDVPGAVAWLGWKMQRIDHSPHVDDYWSDFTIWTGTNIHYATGGPKIIAYLWHVIGKHNDGSQPQRGGPWALMRGVNESNSVIGGTCFVSYSAIGLRVNASFVVSVYGIPAPQQSMQGNVLTGVDLYDGVPGQGGRKVFTLSSNPPPDSAWTALGTNGGVQVRENVPLPLAAQQALMVGNPHAVINTTAYPNGQLIAPLRVLGVEQPPVITLQPQPVTVARGGSAQFNVAVSGTEPLRYQWLFNGEPISGATDQTLVLNDVQSVQVGLYSVSVYNDHGETTSFNAALSLSNSSASYRIQLAPGWNVMANQLSRGSNTLAEVLPSVPTSTVFYRWDVNTQNYEYSTFEPDFGGWDNPGLPLRPGDGGFLLNPMSTPFDIYLAGEIVTPQLPLILPPERWVLAARQLPAPATYEDITGLSPSEGTRLYRYDAALQGDPSNLSSWNAYTFTQGQWSPATPAVGVGEPVFIRVPARSGLPSIVNQPLSLRVNAGGTAEFRVEATSPEPLMFQWRKDGVDLAGETTSALKLPNVQPGDAGQYDVVIRNSAGAVTSQPAALTVNTAPVLPFVPDQFLHAGAGLRVPIVAADADSPATNLFYTLAAGAPPNVSLDVRTGELFVQTAAGDEGQSFTLTVLVQDDGQPALMDAKTFTVTVAPPLRIVSFTRGEDSNTIAWVSIPGNSYQVLFKRNLQDPWEELFGPVVATGHTATKCDYAVHEDDHKYYTVTTTTTTPRVPTTTTHWQYCVLAPDLRPGKAIKVDIIAPTADITSKKAETIPLIVRGEDEDQMIQQCICIKPEGVLVSARDFNVPDGVQYKWSIEDVDWEPKGAPLPPPFSAGETVSVRQVIANLYAANLLPNLEGPATLFVSSVLNLEVGSSFTVTVKVEVRDVLGNDPRPYVRFKIKVSRTADCTYSHEITKTKVEHADKTVTVTPSQCDCQPLQEEWLVSPALSGNKGTVIHESGVFTIGGGADAPFTVCAGERVILTASGEDFDTVKIQCVGECGYSVLAPALPDELKYTWTGPAGSFPDYGGASAESNGRRTRAIWKAPDTPGDYTVKLVIDDRGGPNRDDAPLPEKTFKLRVIQVKLSIDGVADDEKYCKGRIVCVNSDDDDNGGVNDKDHHPVTGENELVRVVLSKNPPTGTMFLTVYSLYTDEVRIWDSPTKSNQITDNPASFPASTGKELWVEGVNPSRRLRDIELLLESELCQDKGKLTSSEADLDIVKTDDTELAEDKELDPGGYIPVNNDDDDYDGSVDKSDGNGVTGESDFVKLILHKIQPDSLKGKYRLVWSSDKIKLWQKPDRMDEVTSDSTEWDTTTDTTIYVEGQTKSGGVREEKIHLKWIGETTFPQADQVNFTVYEVTGPQNVPGYSIYTYKGDIPGGGTGSWTANDGTIKEGASANTCKILWNEGPVVGKANFTPKEGFTCKREVNVVQVKFKTDASNKLTYKNSPSQDGTWQTLIHSHATGPTMDAKITVEKIAGPTVAGAMRGAKFMELGFIQNGQITRRYADFDGFTPKRRRQNSLQDGAYHLDHMTGASASTPPWYDTKDATGTDGFLAPGADAEVNNHPFNITDTPRLVVTDMMNLTIGGTTDATDRFGVEFDFNLYFAVRTTETINDSEKVFTKRAAGAWEFDGSGTVDGTGAWTLTGAGNTGSASFTIVNDGSVVPVTTGTAINNLFEGTWATVNQ